MPKAPGGTNPLDAFDSIHNEALGAYQVQALPRKSELDEITATPPSMASAKAEREASYFGSMWPGRRCPDGLRGSAVRHDSSRSMPDADFHRPSHKPPAMSVANRLRFERGAAESNTG